MLSPRKVGIAFLNVLIVIFIIAMIPAVLLCLINGLTWDIVEVLKLAIAGLSSLVTWLKNYQKQVKQDDVLLQGKPNCSDELGHLSAKVREHWIEGVFERSRIGDVWLDLEGMHVPEVVETQIEREFHRKGSETILLDSGTKITELFRRKGRALLILGEPGSGKTMTLLELAKDLLDRAEADHSLPVPVVFNLASWAKKCPKKLEDWLVERLLIDYRVSRGFGKRCIANGDLFFLLDGLDEVPLHCRDACVKAISDFWQPGHDWADNGIVVCSRRQEYTELAEKLHLQSAICLKPLTLVQTREYLGQLGEEWKALSRAVTQNKTLREFSTSPLLLNIMAIAYAGVSLEQIASFPTEKAQHDHLFCRYIVRCLRSGNHQLEYTHQQTRCYLAWLAYKMMARNLPVFYIEELQPDWLGTPIWCKRYKFFVLFIIGLVFGLGFAVLGGLIAGIIGALILGSLFSVFGGLSVAWKVNQIALTERLKWSWANVRSVSVSRLVIGLGGVFVIGLISVLYIAKDGGMLVGLGVGPVFLLVYGLFVVLDNGITHEMIEQRTVPNQGIWSSLRSARLVMLTSMVISVFSIALILGGLGGVLGGGLIGGVLFGMTVGVGAGLAIGAFVGLILALYYGGLVVIQHFSLRIFLWHFEVAPRNYAKFLKYVCERHLMRQVGGGFIFRHRTLMEYFATQAQTVCKQNLSLDPDNDKTS
ncbi:MAG: NACHT domain-containing protein [Anaerolineae bacterium]|nr:NACHT domain-containing protein [Anaerolineae bacterium]